MVNTDGTNRHQSGQALPFFVLCMVMLCLFWFMMINLGKLVKDRMMMQNAADNAALTASILKARALNQLGLINRTLGFFLQECDNSLPLIFIINKNIKNKEIINSILLCYLIE